MTQELRDLGFTAWATGGGCEAMGLLLPDKTIVVTTTDGGHLPTNDDWLLCVYVGDWSKDAETPIIDNIDHESSPVHLSLAAELAIGKASK